MPRHNNVATRTSSVSAALLCTPSSNLRLATSSPRPGLGSKADNRFFAASGVQLAQTNKDHFHLRSVVFYSQLESEVGNILPQAVVLRINLNIDDAPIASRLHTHPSHSPTSRLLSSSLSLGIPFPRSTQCVRGFQIPQF